MTRPIAIRSSYRSMMRRDSIPVGQDRPSPIRPSLDLALILLGASLFLGLILEVASSGSGQGLFASERSILEVLGTYKPVLLRLHPVPAVLAAALLLRLLLKDLPSRRAFPSRRGSLCVWYGITIAALGLALVTGSDLLGIAPEGRRILHTRIAAILIFLPAFRLSLGVGEDLPAASGTPGSWRAGPPLSWCLDCGLLAGTASGLLDLTLTGIRRFPAFHDWKDLSAAAGMVLGVHALHAVLLAIFLWAVWRALGRLEKRWTGRWPSTDLDFLAGCCLSGILCLYLYVTSYYSLYSPLIDTAYGLPAGSAVFWCSIVSAPLFILGLQKSRREGGTGRDPSWLHLLTGPLLVPTLPFCRSLGRIGSRNAWLRRIAPAILPCSAGLLLISLILGKDRIFRSYQLVFAQWLVAALLVLALLVRARGAKAASRVGLAVRLLVLAALPLVVLGLFRCDRGVLTTTWNHFELFRGLAKSLRGMADLDRDGYAGLFEGGDPDDLDPALSPVEVPVLIARAGPAADPPPSLPDAPDPPLADPPGMGMHLVIITFDALRADALGCGGSTRGASPRIDAFSRESGAFLHHHSTSSNTRGALRAFSTGRPCSRRIGRRITDPTFIRDFVRQGTFGKYILPNTIPVMLVDWESPENFPPETPAIRPPEVTDCRGSFRFLLEELDRLPSGKTLFAWTHLMDTHFEYEFHPDGKDFGRSNRDLYDNTISSVDRAFGEFIDALKEKGLDGRTVILLTADHGTAFGEHGSIYHGPHLYQEIIHLPLIIRIPGAPPRTVRAPTSHLDIAPTLADLFGIDRPREPYPGISLARELLGAGRELPMERSIFFISGWGDTWAVLKDRRWKLIHGREDNTWELFDLDRDPLERVNLIGRAGAIETELQRSLYAFLASGYDRYGDPHHLRGRLNSDLDRPDAIVQATGEAAADHFLDSFSSRKPMHPPSKSEISSNTRR
jgi:choline-sulfatase